MSTLVPVDDAFLLPVTLTRHPARAELVRLTLSNR